MNEIRAKIIVNLSDRAYPVNYPAAVSGISDLSAACEELIAMRNDGVINVSKFGPGSRPTGPDVYKLSLSFLARNPGNA